MQELKPYLRKLSNERTKCHTSYVSVPPEESGWRIVTFEIAPFAEMMQIDRGPCWENEITFIVTSCKPEYNEDRS